MAQEASSIRYGDNSKSIENTDAPLFLFSIAVSELTPERLVLSPALAALRVHLLISR
jgi:hypothetical protein